MPFLTHNTMKTGISWCFHCVRKCAKSFMHKKMMLVTVCTGFSAPRNKVITNKGRYLQKDMAPCNVSIITI